MKTIFSILENRAPKTIINLSFLVILLLGLFQIITGNGIDITPLYVFPPLFSSWYGSRKAGLLSALLSVFVLSAAEVITSEFAWTLEGIVLFGMPYLFTYALLAALITNFRDVHRIEAHAADTDSLTGVHSARSFYAELANELLRCKRYDHQFSLAYLDVDDFKQINDSLGHAVGDTLLKEVANCLVRSLRSTDIVARLGGDEFVCLLPETDQSATRPAFFKAVDLLNKQMSKHRWDVGFSIGVVTFENLPEDIKEAIDAADQLMYSVKNHHKNNVAYEVY